MAAQGWWWRGVQKIAGSEGTPRPKAASNAMKS